MRYMTLLRRPELLLLWLGQVCSSAGDRLYSLAMLWLTFSLTGSARAMASVALAESFMFAVVGLVGGAWVDRVNRNRAATMVDIVRAMIVLMVPVLDAFGCLGIGWLALLGVLMGALGAVFAPAFEAMIPQCVHPDELSGVAGLMDTPSRFARLLGPGMASALLTWIPVTGFFVLDAVSFIISAASLTMLRRFRPVTDRQPLSRHDSLRIDILAGVRILVSDRPLRSIYTMDALGNAAFVGFTLGSMLLATKQFHSGLGGYGVLMAAYGAGSLVGNFAAGNVRMGPWTGFAAMAGWSGVGVGFILLGLSASMDTAFFAVVTSGAAGAMAHVTRAAFIASRVPSQHLGKLYSLSHITTTLSGALGTMLVGWLLDTYAAGAVVTCAGLFLVLTNLTILSFYVRPARMRNRAWISDEPSTDARESL